MLDRSWEVQPVTWSQLTWWDPLPCGQLLLAHLGKSASGVCGGPLFPSPAVSMRPNPPTPHRRLPPTHLNFNNVGGGGSSSSSPIPFTRRRSVATVASYLSLSSSSSMSNCSPLAVPLPLSPDSFSSVFLPDSPPWLGESPLNTGACAGGGSLREFSVALPFHEASTSPGSNEKSPDSLGLQGVSRSFTVNSDSAAMMSHHHNRNGGGGGGGGSVSLLPTPPNSNELNTRRRGGGGMGGGTVPAGNVQRQKMFSFPAPPPILSPGLLPMPPPLLSRPPPFLR